MRVIGKNRHLGQVLLEQIVDPAGMGLAARLVDDAEATETVGGLADSLEASGGIRAHVVQAENVSKQVKLATSQEVLDAVADRCTAGPVTGLAILVQGRGAGNTESKVS
jgi:hypothetical protein